MIGIETFAVNYVDLVEPFTDERRFGVKAVSASILGSAFKRLEVEIIRVRNDLSRGEELKREHYNPAEAGLISFSKWKLAYA